MMRAMEFNQNSDGRDISLTSFPFARAKDVKMGNLRGNALTGQKIPFSVVEGTVMAQTQDT